VTDGRTAAITISLLQGDNKEKEWVLSSHIVSSQMDSGWEQYFTLKVVSSNPVQDEVYLI
jgi:hypothetical protein